MKATDTATRNRGVLASRPAVLRMSRALTITYGVFRTYRVSLLEWSPWRVPSPAEWGVTERHWGEYRPTGPAVSCVTITACYLRTARSWSMHRIVTST